MPVLQKIIIQNFRNIELQEVAFSPNINCIWGGNGEGKTNLLDAVHYLSMTKSGIQAAEKFNFRHGCNSFAISGLYTMKMALKAVSPFKSRRARTKKSNVTTNPIPALPTI